MKISNLTRKIISTINAIKKYLYKFLDIILVVSISIMTTILGSEFLFGIIFGTLTYIIYMALIYIHIEYNTKIPLIPLYQQIPSSNTPIPLIRQPPTLVRQYGFNYGNNYTQPLNFPINQTIEEVKF